MSFAVTVAFDVKGNGFSALQANISRAIAQGLNEGGDLVRTRVQKGLWKQAGTTKYSSITSRMRTARAYVSGAPKSGVGPVGQGSLTYQIIASGKGIPIKEFPVRLTGCGVSAEVWGVAHQFKRSFGKNGSDVDGFRARIGKDRFPIRKLYGPALPKELAHGAIPGVFRIAVDAYVIPAIIKRLGRVVG